MTETKVTGGGSEPLAPQAALVRARTDAQALMAKLGLRPEDASELTRVIDSAIDERFGEFDDLRIGRVIGAALATL
ncbi:MAG TPA: hypothetical protein VGS19_37410 [Streptosporangiaceae bacterium]|nr:hypothetical protein [Streptosporangiaceae bacterium]